MTMELIGFDIGARGVTGVVIDGEGRLLRRARRDGDPADVLRDVFAELGHRSYDACGIAADNVVDAGQFGPSGPPQFVHTSTPGAAAVAAEAWVGGARGARDAVCLWIGDRVLAGVLLNGQPWLGAHGLAGAAGWLALNPVERQDYRKFGSFAAEVSDKGIARRLAWRIQAGDHSAVLERAGDLDAITAAHVFEGARSGDGVAISVVRDTARYVGMATANLIAAFDPEVIVLGGPIAGAGDLLIDPARQECGRRLPPPMANVLRFEVSPLASDGIAIGAASLALVARDS